MSDKDSGIINIHGKQYHTVARRVTDFRSDLPDHLIVTELLDGGDTVQVKAEIRSPDGLTISTGHAEEVRGSSNINKTSALENCETSAVGRALAFFGYGGTEISSADELATALEQQQQAKEEALLVRYNEAVRDHFQSIALIKSIFAESNPVNSYFYEAYEAFAEIPQDDWQLLWRAPSKGGIWTTAERALFKSNDWNDARKAYHNIED